MLSGSGGQGANLLGKSHPSLLPILLKKVAVKNGMFLARPFPMIESINQHMVESARPEHEIANRLEPADMYDLMAVQDLLDADEIASAHEQMEKIALEKRNHPSVLYIAYQLHAKTGDWDQAIQSAERLFKQTSDFSTAWIVLADAACHKPAGSVLEAKEILMQAHSKFPGKYLIPYKLAGYCVQLLQFDEADKWIKQAAAIGGERVAQLAMNDKNLAPLYKQKGNEATPPANPNGH
jgi:tetratricopeptide (TPR) repeat protein